LLRCIDAAASVKAKGDEKIGVGIVTRALQAPIRQIAENCGVDGSVIADEVHITEALADILKVSVQV
jgi:chaperonin GroEL